MFLINNLERTCSIPEGPEIKISKELIKPLVLNKTISQFFNYGRYAEEAPEGQQQFREYFDYKLTPKVIDVSCKGKFMYWTFDNGTNDKWYMFSTFGMTGRWSPQVGKHPCLELVFTGGSYIYFNDPRHFGTIKFTNSKKELKDKLNSLGWDPFQGSLENWLPWIQNELSKSNKPIGQVLLDQSIFAGVGNYLRAEILYDCKISPWRSAKSLTKDETRLLCQSAINIMNKSYEHQGATISTYKDAYGNEGKYSSCFQVYGKKTDPSGYIVRSEQTPEGRTIHWCPEIQK